MNFLTVGDIAKRVDADRDAVSYALRKSRVEPVGRAGIVRLFPETAVRTVKEFLQRKRQSRREVHPCTA